MVVKTRLDTIHYTLSDLIGQTLPDVYHINRLKQARVMTSHGIVISIKGLTRAETIALQCALPEVSNKKVNMEKLQITMLLCIILLQIGIIEPILQKLDGHSLKMNN